MSNMSYCRFQNTLNDFRECAEALQGLESGDQAPLSREELQAAKQLMQEAAEMLQVLSENQGGEITIDDNDINGAIDDLQQQAADFQAEEEEL